MGPPWGLPTECGLKDTLTSGFWPSEVLLAPDHVLPWLPRDSGTSRAG